MKFIDLIGQRFGRLVITKQAGKDKCGAHLWLCQCDCGNITTVRSGHLIRGAIKSCGCLRNETASSFHTEHGYSNDPIYYPWRNMIQRCINPNNVAYHNYGGRGITVCKRWLYSFPNFKTDMPGWKPGLTLERDKNELGYFKNNCYWATRKEQSRNTRRNLYVPYKGEKRLLIELCEEHNVSYKLVYNRIHKLGWSIEGALITFVRKHKKYKKRRK